MNTEQDLEADFSEHFRETEGLALVLASGQKIDRLAELAPKSVLLFRQSMMRDLERAQCLAGARLLYPLWEGYLKAL